MPKRFRLFLNSMAEVYWGTLFILLRKRSLTTVSLFGKMNLFRIDFQ